MPPMLNHTLNINIAPSEFRRAESSLAINPTNPRNIVVASKRFTNPQTYEFSISAYSTVDGGQRWREVQLQYDSIVPAVTASTDPVVVFSVAKGAKAAKALIFSSSFFGPAEPTTEKGIVVHASIDGGKSFDHGSWFHMNVPRGGHDDETAATADNDPRSPFQGQVYVAWIGGVQFGRIDTQGRVLGVGNEMPGSVLTENLLVGSNGALPKLAVANDGSGALYLAWVGDFDLKLHNYPIYFRRSDDGGGSFSKNMVAARPRPAPNNSPFKVVDNWTTVPPGNFRTPLLHTMCAGAKQTVLLAWSQATDEGVRTYFRRSVDGGRHWEGPEEGSSLLSAAQGLAPQPGEHDLQPVLASPGCGIGCAFYRFGPKMGRPMPYLIDTYVALSTDDGGSFGLSAPITDAPWNPALNNIFSHGDPMVTFIGDYFGLASFPVDRLAGQSSGRHAVVWTDTRNGFPEQFFSAVETAVPFSCGFESSKVKESDPEHGRDDVPRIIPSKHFVDDHYPPLPILDPVVPPPSSPEGLLGRSFIEPNERPIVGQVTSPSSGPSSRPQGEDADEENGPK